MPVSKTDSKVYKILALGDSYTIGQSVSTEERYPVQLVSRLQEAKVNTLSPKIIAQTGWTTRNLIDAIKYDGDTGTYDFVLLLIGVNNQYQGRTVDEYRSEFKTLLNTSIKFAGNKSFNVFVVSIPDWGYSPFANGRNKLQISAEIDTFNNINKEESLAIPGVNYIYITDISRSTDSSLIASDGLHPSGRAYGLWVERILPILKTKL